MITAKVTAILDKSACQYDIKWTYNGQPFITEPGNLTDAVAQAIFATKGIKTELSTSGGTSDARFIAPTGAQVVELGPINATIHKVNESTNIQQLEELVTIYKLILKNILR